MLKSGGEGYWPLQLNSLLFRGERKPLEVIPAPAAGIDSITRAPADVAT